MDHAKLNAAMQIVKTMTLEEQRALNSMLCTNIRAGLRVKAVGASINYSIGDVVQFDGKTRGPIFIEITGFSRDLTKMKGKQLNRGWKTAAGTPRGP